MSPDRGRSMATETKSSNEIVIKTDAPCATVECARAPIKLSHSLIIYFWFAFLLSRVIIVTFLAGRMTDLGVQRNHAWQMISGMIPFRDFVAEYPPLALLFAYLPGLIGPSFAWYDSIFRALCCIVDCSIWA